MRLLNFALSTACLMSLLGCTTVPDEPDFTLDLVGDHEAIADCTYLALRESSNGWSKVDLPSLRKIEVINGDVRITAGKIDFIDRGPRTLVRSFFPTPIWGKQYWPNRFRPIITKCARGS